MVFSKYPVDTLKTVVSTPPRNVRPWRGYLCRSKSVLMRLWTTGMLTSYRVSRWGGAALVHTERGQRDDLPRGPWGTPCPNVAKTAVCRHRRNIMVETIGN